MLIQPPTYITRILVQVASRNNPPKLNLRTMRYFLAILALLVKAPTVSHASHSVSPKDAQLSILPGGACRFLNDSRNIWWMSCPAIGLNRTLSLGVNHVENGDTSDTPCRNGTFGPVHNTSVLGEFCAWFTISWDATRHVSPYYGSTIDR